MVAVATKVDEVTQRWRVYRDKGRVLTTEPCEHQHLGLEQAMN